MENIKDTKRLDTKNAQIKDIVSREFSKFVSFVSPFGPFFRRQNSSQIVKYVQSLLWTYVNRHVTRFWGLNCLNNSIPHDFENI